jgi:uncharacterized repeat protein (TIGR03803 family)
MGRSFSRGPMIFIVLMVACAPTLAQQEKVLHSFNADGEDGAFPIAGMVFDKAGNLYGTTVYGGRYNYGAVFELMPASGGGWTERILHSFNNNGKDGYSPYGSLVFDSSGNLYGTTYLGGENAAGTVFELTQASAGGWSEQVIHSFSDSSTSGRFPTSGLIFDVAGNLYGTTNEGGTYGYGTAFELMAKPGGGWVQEVLHSFDENGVDGYFPFGGLVFDSAGNLYGTAYLGGAYSNTFIGGIVFELMPMANGTWTETIVHSFGSGQDGVGPYAGLLLDGAGNLFGTTFYGGADNSNYQDGTVFELSPGSGGSWTESVLHSFGGGQVDGWGPYGGVVLDSAGNLYGATENTLESGDGVLFKLAPSQGGTWTETILTSFAGTNGNSPRSTLAFDGKGNLYGTTFYGGAHNCGVVFEVAP